MRALILAVLCLAACATSPEPAPPRAAPIASLSQGVWLKGDLHIHSRHSKDSSNNPVSKIIALGEAVHMDFLAITDHDNHVLGDTAHHTWADPELKSDKLVLLYGAEWTTHRGHANTFSARPYDHQSFYDIRDDRDAKIGALKRRLGIHLSANHPSGADNFGFSFDIVDSVEVWNSAVWPRNAGSMAIWDDMLKSGRKLTGRGGSDSHHGYPDRPELAVELSRQAPANNVGTPTTWVYATSRTPEAVIAALGNGRVSISANPYVPRLEFDADVDGDGAADMMMGDNARAPGRAVGFRVRLVGAASAEATYTISVIKDGAPFRKLEARGAAEARFTDTPESSGRTYYRVQVEGPVNAYPEVPQSAERAGGMVAISNPICFNFDPAF